jgi:hypothetical protein
MRRNLANADREVFAAASHDDLGSAVALVDRALHRHADRHREEP